jgi:small-conductance mechanosensitive channel
MDAAQFANLAGMVMDIHLFSVFDTNVTVGSAVAVAVILFLTWLVSRVARKAFERLLGQEELKDPGTVRVAQRLTHFVILLVGMGVALETVGFDLTALFTAGAVFAVGIGFATKNIVENFVSGVILLLERSIKPGDILEVERAVVKVVRMGIRATVVRTRNEEEMIMPNSMLAQGLVKNYTMSDSSFLLGGSVGVVYGSDMKKVREVLEKTAREIRFRDTRREPRILMREFGDSSVVFDVFVWIDDPWNARRLGSDLNEAVWWALKAADITIAFPQVDVHLDPPVEESLRLAAATPAA